MLELDPYESNGSGEPNLLPVQKEGRKDQVLCLQAVVSHTFPMHDLRSSLLQWTSYSYRGGKGAQSYIMLSEVTHLETGLELRMKLEPVKARLCSANPTAISRKNHLGPSKCAVNCS